MTAAPTTTAVDSDIHPSTFGQSVKFTATITPQTGSLDGGTVQFYDGSDTLGSPQTVDTSTDTGTLDVSSLDVATHTITAVYSGNDDFDTSTSPDFTQEVDKAPTTTAVDSDTHPSTFGQSVKFTATITPQTGALDGGTVQFYDGSDTLGSPQTVDTSTDTATLDVSSLDVATHTITAVYSGNDDFDTSTSPDFTQEVDKAPTTTTVDSDTNPSAYAQSVKFTATIDSADATPGGGTVQFYDGADPLGSPQSVGADGKASYTTAALSASSHQITASYSGNGSFEGGNSAALTQTVGKAATTTTVGSLDPVAYGQNVELRATVSSQDAVPDGGTVQFYNGSDALGGPRPVGADGKAAYTTTTPLEVGDHSITAAYSGDGRFLTSDSHATPVVQRITRDASSVTVDGDGSPSTVSGTVTFTATVAASNRDQLQGTVEFFDGDTSLGDAQPVDAQTHTASLRVTGLHGGSHAIVGVYSGDARRAGSDNRSDPYDQTVQRATSSTAVSGDAAKLTAIVTSAAGQPGGLVTFSDGDAVIGTATLDSSGHASIAPATLASGTHHIAAAYGGDGDFAPSTGAFDLLVPGAPSSGKEPIGRASLAPDRAPAEREDPAGRPLRLDRRRGVHRFTGAQGHLRYDASAGRRCRHGALLDQGERGHHPSREAHEGHPRDAEEEARQGRGEGHDRADGRQEGRQADHRRRPPIGFARGFFAGHANVLTRRCEGGRRMFGCE